MHNNEWLVNFCPCHVGVWLWIPNLVFQRCFQSNTNHALLYPYKRFRNY